MLTARYRSIDTSVSDKADGGMTERSIKSAPDRPYPYWDPKSESEGCCMRGSPCSVPAWCENPNMNVSLLGASVNLGLQFSSVSSLSEAREVLLEPSALIAFVQCSSLCSERLAFISESRARSRTSVVVIVDSDDEKAENRAIRAGAVACLGYLEVLMNVSFYVKDTVAALLRDADPRLFEKRLIPISDQIGLAIPDFCLVGDGYEVYLTPISGALLMCLASRPNVTVPRDELVLAGWGSSAGITRNALNQRIHRLRFQLGEFGLLECIKAVRGVGFKFIPPSSCE